MQRVGIGIIGLGMAVKPHALALRDLADRADVIGGYSPTPERRTEFTRAYGLPTVDSLDVLLADPRVQAVLVLTPPRTHAELAVRAARAGKHVLLEKPVDVSLQLARATVEAVEREGRKLGVVFQYRFRPGTATLRKLLRDGELGDLLSASCAVRWWRPPEYYAQPGRGMRARDGGGVLLTQSIHTLDVLLDLAGPVKRVSAQCRTSPLRSIDTEDIACAAVEYRNGAVGVVDATTVAYPGFPGAYRSRRHQGQRGAGSRAARGSPRRTRLAACGWIDRGRGWRGPDGLLARAPPTADRGFPRCGAQPAASRSRAAAVRWQCMRSSMQCWTRRRAGGRWMWAANSPAPAAHRPR